MVKDIHTLFAKNEEEKQASSEEDVLYLWDSKKGIVENGINYSED
jgi:hypothetical protein